MRKICFPLLILLFFSCQFPRLERSQLEFFGFLRILGGANKFSLGGTVSGLLSGGSVEVRSGTLSVTVSQDGVFAFPTRLDSGTSYDLSLTTSGNAFMNCSITNGKGIVQTVDINDVTINCGLGPGFYEIGVNVSGITAPITVQNNGTDSQSFSTAGLYKFTTPIQTGNNYAVTISSQSAGSVCSFVNPTTSAGTVATTNITVVIRCIPGYLNSGTIHNVASADLFPNLTSFIPYLRTMVGSYPTNAGGTGPQFGNVDNTNAELARFNNPKGIASDGTYFYVADYDNDTIRRINKSNGEVTTIAGGATGGGTTCPGAVTTNCLDGIGTAAQFYRPFQLTTDGVSLYVLEFLGNRIRKINLANAEVSTLAGSGSAAFADNTDGILASFLNPHGILLHQGTLYVADRNNNRIRAVNPVTGAVSTFAGGAPGFLDANGTTAQFFGPIGIASVGNYLYIADHGNNRIRRIDLTSPYPVTTIAGQALAGSLDGFGTAAQFDGPFAMTSDGTNLIVSEYYTYKIRHIRLSNNKVTTLVGGIIGYRDSAGLNAAMQRPVYPTSDGTNIYLTEEQNHAIRRIENAEILRYTFDGNLNDTVGTNNAVPTGAPAAVTDEKGTASGAFELNGTSHLISSGSNINFLGNPITDDLTMSLWVHPSGKIGNQFLFYNGLGGSNGYGIMFDGTSRRIRISLGGVMAGPDSADLLPLNQWSHIALTRNDGNWQMYINGISQGIAFNTNPNTPAASLKIGDAGNGFYFQGKVSDFRFFKGALDHVAIQKLAAQIPNGLIAYYPLNGNSNDFSGNDNHLTLNTASLSSDRNGYGNSAYSFDGTTFLTRTSSFGLPSGNQNRTQCAWIRTTSTVGQYILGYGTMGASSGSGLVIDSTMAGIFGVTNDTVASHDGITGEWVHLCGTYDGTNASVYLNGVLRNTESKTWNTTANTAIQVGRLIDGTSNFYGSIDEVRIYNRVLSQTEIRALSGVHPTQVSTWSTTLASRSLKFFLKPENTAYTGGLCPGGINCVYDWYDRSGNNFHLTQGSSASRPAYEINVMRGKPGIRFFGSTVTPSFLSRACEPVLNGTSNTIFATYREVNLAGNNGIFQNGSPTAGKLLYIVRNIGNNPILFNLLSNTQSTQATADYHGINETAILSVDYNGTTGTIRKNGAVFPSSSNATPTFSCGGGTLDIGRYYFGGIYPLDGGYFDGHIGDFLYFEGVLSTADRELVQCYLSNRYNLPVSHSCP